MKKRNSIKLIYNPTAGKKRVLFKKRNSNLEDLKRLVSKYQLEVDFYTTKGPNDATKAAKKAIKEGYEIVLAAGGDGTVSEVANGLIGSNVRLGIIPLGTFMNIARMLSVPSDIETAIAIIKIGRTRKIDVGSVTKVSGTKLDKPYYFLESAGVGLDADLFYEFRKIEEGKFLNIFAVIKIYLSFFSNKIKMMIDDQEKSFTSTLITFSNGPYTGPSFKIAPDAKLNDHKLTISVYKMSKLELLAYFLRSLRKRKRKERKVEVFQGDIVKVISVNTHLHADATLFGYSPVTFKVVPNALDVICGFPDPDSEPVLKKRTSLDPG